MAFLRNKEQKVPINFGGLLLAVTVTLLFAALVALCYYSLPYSQYPSSPDGVANITFAKYFHDKGTFDIPQSKVIPNQLSEYFIPRSTIFSKDTQSITLMSYFGLPVILSLFVDILPLQIVYALVGLIGILSLCYIVYKLDIPKAQKYFSYFAVTCNPILLYYIVNGHMHNVLFFSFLALSVALLLIAKNHFSNILVFTSGISLGLAVATRTNEIFWAVLIIVATIIVLERKISLKKVAILLCGAFLTILPFIGFAYRYSGTITQYSTQADRIVSGDDNLFSRVNHYLFPLGIEPIESLKTLYHFSNNVWWLVYPGVLTGFLLMIIYLRKKQWQGFATLCLVAIVAVYLTLYYGPTGGAYPQQLSINLSYFRYMLFVFVIMPVVPAIFFSLLKRHRIVITTLYTLAVLTLSTVYALNTKVNFSDLHFENTLARQRSSYLAEALPPNSVIIAGKADKYLFPRYTVSGVINDKNREEFVTRLSKNPIEEAPVYYYYIDADIDSHKTKDSLWEAGFLLEESVFFKIQNSYEIVYKLEWPGRIIND